MALGMHAPLLTAVRAPFQVLFWPAAWLVVTTALGLLLLHIFWLTLHQPILLDSTFTALSLSWDDGKGLNLLKMPHDNVEDEDEDEVDEDDRARTEAVSRPGGFRKYNLSQHTAECSP